MERLARDVKPLVRAALNGSGMENRTGRSQIGGVAATHEVLKGVDAQLRKFIGGNVKGILKFFENL